MKLSSRQKRKKYLVEKALNLLLKRKLIKGFKSHDCGFGLVVRHGRSGGTFFEKISIDKVMPELLRIKAIYSFDFEESHLRFLNVVYRDELENLTVATID